MTHYALVLAGTSSPMVRAAFPGMTIDAIGGGRIKIAGEIPDQAALHGVLHRLQGLGLAIIDVHRLPDSPDDGPASSPQQAG